MEINKKPLSEEAKKPKKISKREYNRAMAKEKKRQDFLKKLRERY
jgi:hypothetical protein